MKDKKALFFDIDGTILSEITHEVPESAIRAIQKARENGCLTFINTGRTRSFVPESLINLGFDGVLCGCGTEIVFQGKSLHHDVLSAELCREIASLVIEAGMGVLFEGDIIYFYAPKRPSFDFMRRDWSFQDEDVEVIFDWSIEDELRFEKFCLFADKESNIELVKEKLEGKMDMIDRAPGFFEVVPHGYSKAKSIQIVQDIFKIPLENTYVFGDSSNDLSMFEYSPNSIAMKKHDPILDAHALFITDSVEDDGIEKALTYLGLI